MITRTLLLSNARSVRTKNNQLVVERINPDGDGYIQDTVPLEDISVIEVDSQQTTISSAVLARCAEYNVALVTCDAKHMPTSLVLPLVAHSSFTERLKPQLHVSIPMRKNIWRSVVQAKIRNQAHVLERTNGNGKALLRLIPKVQSGDKTNREAVAARYYWKHLFAKHNCVSKPFHRAQDGVFPNNLLNYSYAILRSVVARALVSTGLHPSIGIFHTNKYNPFCLADDIMEVYRPFVDMLVCSVLQTVEEPLYELTPDIKKRLLALSYLDTYTNQERKPLIQAVSQTTASLWRVLANESTLLILPELCPTKLLKTEQDQLRKNENLEND